MVNRLCVAKLIMINQFYEDAIMMGYVVWFLILYMMLLIVHGAMKDE